MALGNRPEQAPHECSQAEQTACERLNLERLQVSAVDRTAIERICDDVDVWLADLPRDQRAAIEAHVLDEERYSEIAARMGTTVPAARKRVSRGLAAIARHLRHEGARP